MQPLILHLVWQFDSAFAAIDASRWHDALLFCATLSPRVEPYGEREVFVDLTGTTRVEAAIESLITQMEEIHSSKGSIGGRVVATLASNKFVARVGTLTLIDGLSSAHAFLIQASSNVLCANVPQSATLQFLSTLSVKYIWSVEGRVRRRLANLGISTLGELARVPRPRLHNEFGIELGSTLRSLAQGIDPSTVEPRYPLRTLEVYHEFGKEQLIEDMGMLTYVISHLARQLATKLCASGEACSSLLLRMELPHGEAGHALKFRTATWTADVLEQGALRLLGRFVIDSPPYRIALVATDLGLPHSAQPDLFSGPQYETQRRGDKILRSVQRRFGSAAIQYASTLRKGRRERMRAIWHDTLR